MSESDRAERASEDAVEAAIDAAYNEWCRPRMNDSKSDHPAVAFAAGYRAALNVRTTPKEESDR